jgi:N-acetylglucosaminyldiphosphoundecaprenol N-acetyl-beta-D-mannosaminyltransferase
LWFNTAMLASFDPNPLNNNAPQADDVLLLDRRESQRSISFLGVEFAPMDSQTLFERVVETASKQQAFGYLITPNVDQIVRLSQNSDAQALHADAWANVNDSRILELLANQSGFDLPACPGSDLTARLLAEAIDPTEPVVIIGCAPSVVEAIKVRYGLVDVRWYEPPMGLRHKPEAIEATAQFCVNNPARFYFLCVGNPQQEMVARAIKLSGKATGFGLCVGASLEFLAGVRKRAPVWMQTARLEWLFRLLSEPKVLWRRYLVEGPKIFHLWLTWRKSAQP